MGEKNGDARSFWMELEDDGKVDFTFEKVQNVLHSLKQKIKDGSATNKEYIQAMILVNDATMSKNSTLKKLTSHHPGDLSQLSHEHTKDQLHSGDSKGLRNSWVRNYEVRPNTIIVDAPYHLEHICVTQSEQENKPSAFPSTSSKDSFPKDCAFLTLENKKILSLANEDVECRGEKSPMNLSCRSHDCSGACMMKMPSTIKTENPLQLPIMCHFQRRHAKTNTQSSALHVSYKAPCGRSLRNMEEVFRYLLETNCNFLFTENFSFNTFVQLTRNYKNQEEIVSDVDISNGVELVPVSFCNEINSRRLPPFKYRKTIWPPAYYLNNFSNMFTDSCDCSEGCIDITKCACLQLTAKNAKTSHLSSDEITTGYKYKRLQRHIPTGIYECSLLCKCNRQTCQNRVVQHGLQVRLQVFKTEKKGWGVRCLDDIDKGTFVCIYSGRLLINRENPEKPNATDENRKEGNIIKNIFSKKRKIEVAYSDCEAKVSPLELETHPKSAETDDFPPNNPKEPVMEMNCENISRQYHSVIRSSKFKTAIFQQNGKKMELISLDSDTSSENNGFLNCKARRKQKESSSNQVGDSEDNQLHESDVIDITKCREETPPGDRCHPASTFDSENIEVQIKMPQEEKSPARQKQQAFADELLSETKNTSSTSPVKSSNGIVFLLDATKEGNVGRFLNHSCCPNLLVQNVFVETHDRNFPLVAFFTNRYVKARTELTWDYGYKVGTVPNKEILCQCGTNKCRKKIL